MMPERFDPIKFASGCGIPTKQINAWIERKDAKAPVFTDNRPRYDLDGPIISTAEHTYWGNIDGMCSPGSLRAFLDEHKGKDIEINVNSPGGSCWDANSMVADLARHDGAIDIVISGACLSAATFFLAVPNARRLSMPDAEYMIHNAWSLAIGDYRAMEKIAGALKKTNAGIAKKLAKASELSVDEILVLMDAETWMTDEEALSKGFVDQIIDMEDDDDDEEDEPEAMDDDEDREDGDRKPEAVAKAELAMFDRKKLNEIRDLTTQR